MSLRAFSGRLAVVGGVALTFCASIPAAHADRPVAEGDKAGAGDKKKKAGPLAAAEELVAKGDYAAAIETLETHRGGADRLEVLLALAELELTVGKYENAAATATRAARVSRAGKIAAAPLVARALAARGKLDEAIAAVRDVSGDEKARRARLVLGELLVSLGRRGEARAPLMTLIEDYNEDRIGPGDAEGLSMVGRAAHLLRSARDANDAYEDAERAGGNKRVETLVWRAELFLDKYDPGHAGEVLKDALRIAPRHPMARVLLAKAKLDSSMDFEAAESEVSQALEVNPDLPEAYVVRAGLALRDLDLAAADAAVERGLRINPTHLDLLSMKAAVRFLADDAAGFAQAKQRVLAINPTYSRMYQIIGEYAEWEHRYDDIVTMMRDAIKLDKNDGKALATLGLNLIRSGNETEGLSFLREAWTKDKFNVRVYNTLNLFEKEIATDYVTVEGPRFEIRYAKRERPVLERYVPRMLDEAFRSMVDRYGFTPKQPIGIELYERSEAFSIRTSGLPNVGIQGVCFGQTLAALSPGAAPFNWGNVLWHELGHVFAIQLSKSHVPRWFTEGLSEYETIVRRPEWQREEDPALYAALRAGRVPSVLGFNRAFTHVDSVEEVTMAYYAASQLVVYLVEQFGFQRVVAMLPAWGAGKRTDQVITEVLGVAPEDLDRRFQAWLGKRLSRYASQYVPDLHAPPLEDARRAARAAPNDPNKLVAFALALYADGQEPEAEATLAEALRLDPKHADAHYVKLRWAMRDKRLDEADKLVSRLVSLGHDGYAVRMRAADVAEAKKDKKKQREHLEAAARFDPSQAEPLQGLYDLAHEAKDEAGQLAALERLARVDQHDRRVWSKLLEKRVARGQWEEARKVGESAIFVDPMNPEVHRLYARALARTGRHVSAIFELNSAVLCKPKKEDLVKIYEEMAKGYDRLARPDYARKARELGRRAAAGR